MTTAEQIREMLAMQSHPEGGWFAEIFRSDDQLTAEALPPGYSGPRAVSTAIYYMLEGAAISTLHRLRSDEIFHFYLGDPVEQLWLLPDGSHRTVTIGNDLAAGQRPQVVVPGNVWQGARMMNGQGFALLGTTVAPGFDFDDFEIGSRSELTAAWPEAEALIRHLTHA
ncbi:MAG: cupin domain-containing protein [Minwuia sp.]|nr:cupin domain-containing protein [Minwuia sp.]